MSEAVIEILHRIEQLPEEDRLILEERLAELAEAEWKREAESALSDRPRARPGSGGDRQGRPRPATFVMKVFFDTNVYVAEALLGQVAEQLIEATEQASWRI